MNGGPLAQQAPLTTNPTASYHFNTIDNVNAPAAEKTTSVPSANNNNHNNNTIHPFLKMQPQPKQQVDAPSVTPAIATATGTSNGSSNNGTANSDAPSAAVASTANAAAAMSKKRKKDGLKPIITTENPHIGCVHELFSTPSL